MQDWKQNKAVLRFVNLCLADLTLREAREEAAELYNIESDPQQVIKTRALWCSSVVKYSKCFVEGRTFFKSVESKISVENRGLHDSLVEQRHKFFGHNDFNSCSSQIVRVVNKSGKRDIEVTLTMHESLPRLEILQFLSLIEEVSLLLGALRNKAHERVVSFLNEPLEE